MQRKLSGALLFLLICGFAHAQRSDRKLERALRPLLDSFHGISGIYVHDLRHNREVAIRADSVFPTASMIKMTILMGIMDKIHKGELSYHQNLTYDTSILYRGVDILGSFKQGEKIELSKVMMLMLTMSDNTASLWLQGLAGGGVRINAILDSLGFHTLRMNSRTPGREAARSVYGWGQTSPRDHARLMEMIVNHQLVSDSLSGRMLRLLGRNYWDEYAISAIPSDVFVASKGGAVDESRSEILFVNGRGRSYIFCLCTKNNKDMSWTDNNEGWVLARKVSQLLWDRL